MAPSNEDYQQTSQRRNTRNENWIKWDLSSREDHATKWFLKHYKDKASAYGFFVWIVEKMYHANDYGLPHDEIFVDGFADEIGWSSDDVKLALARLCQAKLFVARDGYIYSKRVLKEAQEREIRNNKRSESGRLGGLKKASNSKESLASASPRHNTSSRGDKKRGEEIRVDKSINTNTPPPDKREVHPGVFLSDKEIEKFKTDFGDQFFDRCCEKLSAWIEQDPTPKRKRNGKNGAATFRTWVINAVSEEQRRAGGPVTPQGRRLSIAEKNIEVMKSFFTEDDKEAIEI